MTTFSTFYNIGSVVCARKILRLCVAWKSRDRKVSIMLHLRCHLPFDLIAVCCRWKMGRFIFKKVPWYCTILFPTSMLFWNGIVPIIRVCLWVLVWGCVGYWKSCLITKQSTSKHVIPFNCQCYFTLCERNCRALNSNPILNGSIEESNESQVYISETCIYYFLLHCLDMWHSDEPI